MATLAQLPFGVRYGDPTATTRKMILSSLVNTAMSVACNGSTYPVTLAAVGADRGSGPAQAGYVGNILITGLAVGVSYPYTITQGSNSRSGNIAPFYSSTTKDYSFFILACDNHYSGSGLYYQIKDYAESGALPTVGCFHSDDLGYVDTANVDDTTNAVGVHKSTGLPWVTKKEYDYSIGYLAHLGLLGDLSTSYDTAFGRDEFRVWVRENLPLMPQWGNHEFDGDMGTPGAAAINVQTGTRPNTYHKTASPGFDGPGLVAWNNFFKPLQPSTEFVKTNATISNSWGITLPGVQVVAPDNITYSDGFASTSFFGTGGIDDVLTYLNTTTPFKIVLMNHSIRGLGSNYQGTHYQMEYYVNAEYKRMFTALAGAGPKSIMSNPNTNGAIGVTFCVHGDYHAAMVTQNNQVLAGQTTEMFYSINGASINGSPGHGAFGVVGKTYSGVAGEAATGSTLKYRRPEDNVPKAFYVRVDMHASQEPKYMEVFLMAEEGVAWSGKFYPRSSNDAFPSEWEAVKKVGGSRLI